VRIQVLKAEDCPTGSIKVDTERMKRRETFNHEEIFILSLVWFLAAQL
jgi:hypothetical protein